MTSLLILFCLQGAIGAALNLNTQDTLGFTESTNSTAVSSLTSSIDAVIPGRSYIVKLECHGCPYLGRVYDDDEKPQDANPRPNFLLLNFTVHDRVPQYRQQGIDLSGLEFYPLWYERRTPLFHGYPFPWAPPFKAFQVPAADIISNGPQAADLLPDSQTWPSVELVYTHQRMSIHEDDWQSSPEFLELNITGLRHSAFGRNSVTFNQSDGHRTFGTTHTVRIVFSDKENILAIELGRIDNTTYGTDSVMPSQTIPKENSILGPDWGGRLYKPGEFITFTEFDPGEWNDCGRKDHYWRQFCCKLDEWGTWAQYFGRDDGATITFIIGATLLGLASSVLLCGLLWTAWRQIRKTQGRKRKEKEQHEEETDKLLLEGTENIEEAKSSSEVEAIG